MVSKPLWVFVDVINMYNQLTLNKGGYLIQPVALRAELKLPEEEDILPVEAVSVPP